MNLPEDTHLAYTVWHEAWYAAASPIPGEKPHLMVSAASDGGGVAWEFQIDGYDLSGPVTRVKMFMDSYAAFAQMPEFFAALADQRPVTLDEVREILHALGAVDETPRESPYPARNPSQRERVVAELNSLRVPEPDRVADIVLSMVNRGDA
jgi:hypothetical protein